ncbi:hypothetical protein QCA50_003354 [Cerrena zonata]|uniref:MFS general substrate transporter n=1 Tax=Cerrena zonata TaxID=2478898 RepID=A0AAW0GPF5_9APHY
MSTSRSSSNLRSRSLARPENVSTFANPEAAAVSEGPIDESTVEALHEFVHPHHATDDTLVEDDDPIAEERHRLPWYRRPSPFWFICMIPFTAVATASCLAPRIEMYTRLACEVYKPEYTNPRDPDAFSSYGVIPAMSDDDTWRKQCVEDPVVGAAVAQLNMIATLFTGIMACLTTGWWSSLSDRYGRLFIIGINAFSLLLVDSNFIFVSTFYRVLPGGYWFYLVGNFFDGVFGGLPTVSAAIHAYTADCTDAHSRSRIFALFVGIMFFGTALGPTLGGVLIKYTGNLVVVWYLSLSIHVLYACMVWFVIPESLTKGKMSESKRLYQEDLNASGTRPVSWMKRIFGFLAPLNVFLVQPKDANGNPLKRKGFMSKWNLPLIAISYGLTTMLYGSYSYKFQYVSLVWGWSSEQIGYWLSVIGATRAIYLAVVFPAIIHVFKPKARPIQLPTEPSEPLQPEQSGSSTTPSPSTAVPPPSVQAQALHFDLILARVSLFIETIAFIAMPLSPNATVFTIWTMVTTFGSGFSAAIQNVALIMYTENGGKESGKLFGAISVIQTLCTSIFGPSIFGLTYMKTVGTMPAAIFYLSGAVITVAFVALSMVRLPCSSDENTELVDVEESTTSSGTDTERRDIPHETLVGVPEESELRGRKKPSSSSE